MRGLRRLLTRRSLPIAVAGAAGSGVLLWLAVPPADLGPLGLVALVPLLWAARGGRARRGALLGLVFGLTYYGLLLSWLIPVTGIGYGALVIGVAAYLALFGMVVPLVWRDDRPARTAMAVGAAWAVVEWFRSAWPFGGWSWVSLGATQHDNPLMLPAASVVGALGLGFLVAAINSLVLASVRRIRAPGEWRRAGWPAVAAVALAVVPVAIPASAPNGPPVDVAIVQGNVPVEIGTASRIIEDNIVARNHVALHARLAGDPPDLAVWPENALDRDPTRDAVIGPLVADAIRAVGSPTLVGAITETPNGNLLNEDLLYSARARVVDRYAKNHLLPFGEYVPFRQALDFIPDVGRVREDLTPGTEPGRFRLGERRFASVICFENAFPDLVRGYVTADSGFLVVSTNNSTFGISAAPDQHVVLSELRAVETGRWVVHAALSGISAMINAQGEVTRSTPLFRRAILRGTIRSATGTTVYDELGGWLPLLFLVLLGISYVAPRRARPRDLTPLPARPRVAVVLPTFDERDTIEEVIRRMLAACDSAGFPVSVVVVDDASPDGTGEIVRKMASGDGRVTLIERPAKQGLGSAYLEGFDRAIREGHDLTVEMDADLSHRPEELPRLLRAAHHHHLVIGSRYVRGGSVRNWTVARRSVSRAGNLYVRVVLGLPVADATAGFRAYRTEALSELIADPVRSEGYGFQVEMAYRAWRSGMAVGEVPITFEDRRFGRSKFSRAIVLEALWKVLRWAVRDRIFRRPSVRGAGPDRRKAVNRATAAPDDERPRDPTLA